MAGKKIVCFSISSFEIAPKMDIDALKAISEQFPTKLRKRRFFGEKNLVSSRHLYEKKLGTRMDLMSLQGSFGGL